MTTSHSNRADEQIVALMAIYIGRAFTKAFEMLDDTPDGEIEMLLLSEEIAKEYHDRYGGKINSCFLYEVIEDQLAYWLYGQKTTNQCSELEHIDVIEVCEQIKTLDYECQQKLEKGLKGQTMSKSTTPQAQPQFDLEDIERDMVDRITPELLLAAVNEEIDTIKTKGIDSVDIGRIEEAQSVVADMQRMSVSTVVTENYFGEETKAKLHEILSAENLGDLLDYFEVDDYIRDHENSGNNTIDLFGITYYAISN